MLASFARTPPQGRRPAALLTAFAAIVLAVWATAAASERPARGTARPRAGTAGMERDVLALVNRHRLAHGLPALALDARVSREARLHSASMAAGTIALGHAGFDARVGRLNRAMRCRRSAENVAFSRGYLEPASEAMRGWLGSPGHRRNIEGPYDVTGIGVASDASGAVYVTQIFLGACPATSRSAQPSCR